MTTKKVLDFKRAGTPANTPEGCAMG